MIVDFAHGPNLPINERKIFSVVLNAYAFEIIVKSPGQPL